MAGLWGLVWALRTLLCVLLLVHGQVRVGATGCKKRKPLFYYLLSQVSDQRVRKGLDLTTYTEFAFSCTCVYPFTCKDTLTRSYCIFYFIYHAIILFTFMFWCLFPASELDHKSQSQVVWEVIGPDH
jgi:hypothetical protein